MAARNVFRTVTAQLASGTTNDTNTFTLRYKTIAIQNPNATKTFYCQVGTNPSVPSSSASFTILPNTVLRVRAGSAGTGANRGMTKVRVKGTTTNQYTIWGE